MTSLAVWNRTWGEGGKGRGGVKRKGKKNLSEWDSQMEEDPRKKEGKRYLG